MITLEFLSIKSIEPVIIGWDRDAKLLLTGQLTDRCAKDLLTKEKARELELYFDNDIENISVEQFRKYIGRSVFEKELKELGYVKIPEDLEGLIS